MLLALLLAPYLRKFSKFTVPDFVGERYYSKAARVVALVCAIFVSFTYVAGQMRGVGVVFSRFLEVDINLGVGIGMVIVFFYAVLGGQKGITYTQVAQYCVLIFAYMVPAFFISIMMTGNVIPQLGFGAELKAEPGVFLLDKLDGISTELGFAAFTGRGSKSIIDVFKILDRYSIPITINNIMGFPDETRELIFDTIELNRQLGTDSVNAYIFTRLGTPDSRGFQRWAEAMAMSGEWRFALGSDFYKHALAAMYRWFSPSLLLGEQLSILVFTFSKFMSLF